MDNQFPVGTLVKRSARWLQQHGGPQLGIVIAHISTWEAEDWPVVFWEGCQEAEPTYPPHLEPALTLEGNVVQR